MSVSPRLRPTLDVISRVEVEAVFLLTVLLVMPTFLIEMTRKMQVEEEVVLRWRGGRPAKRSGELERGWIAVAASPGVLLEGAF